MRTATATAAAAAYQTSTILLIAEPLTTMQPQIRLEVDQDWLRNCDDATPLYQLNLR